MRDVATSSIVRVILRVFSTVLMRRLSSRPLAIMRQSSIVCRESSTGSRESALVNREPTEVRRSPGNLLVRLDPATQRGLGVLRDRLLGLDGPAALRET